MGAPAECSPVLAGPVEAPALSSGRGNPSPDLRGVSHPGDARLHLAVARALRPVRRRPRTRVRCCGGIRRHNSLYSGGGGRGPSRCVHPSAVSGARAFRQRPDAGRHFSIGADRASDVRRWAVRGHRGGERGTVWFRWRASGRRVAGMGACMGGRRTIAGGPLETARRSLSAPRSGVLLPALLPALWGPVPRGDVAFQHLLRETRPEHPEACPLGGARRSTRPGEVVWGETLRGFHLETHAGLLLLRGLRTLLGPVSVERRGQASFSPVPHHQSPRLQLPPLSGGGS